MFAVVFLSFPRSLSWHVLWNRPPLLLSLCSDRTESLFRALKSALDWSSLRNTLCMPVFVYLVSTLHVSLFTRLRCQLSVDVTCLNPNFNPTYLNPLLYSLSYGNTVLSCKFSLRHCDPAPPASAYFGLSCFKSNILPLSELMPMFT
jgi:hypothetical protein